MNQRCFIILTIIGLVCIVGCSVTLIAQGSDTFSKSGLYVHDPTFVSADDPNGTLIIDGVNVTYEGEEIHQMGNIIVTNGGRLVLNNTSLVFSQLAPLQYTVTVEKSSELRIESSSFITKYPVSWYIDSSNVTLIDASAAQCVMKGKGHSMLSMSGSHVSGVTLTEYCEMAAIDCGIGETNIGSFSVATLSNSDATSIHLSDSAIFTADVLTCTQIIASDDSACTLTLSECDDLHLWEQSEANVSGGYVQDLGLYDSTSIRVSDCSIGYFVIRSSLTQTLDSLSVDELVCIHYSEVNVISCNIGKLTATNHANLSINSCDLGDVLLTEWSVGYAERTNISSAMITSSAVWFLNQINANYLECASGALVTVLNSTIYQLYAWNFNATTYSYANYLRISHSSIHLVSLGWWTMPVIDDCVIDDASLYHHLILNVTHTNFTNSLRLLDDLRGNFTGCDIALLYTRNIINVTFRNSNIVWQVEPGFETQSITNLPFGPVTFWHPIANGSFDDVSYDLTLIDSIVVDLRIIIGRDVSCSIHNSTFSYAEVANPGYGEFIRCNITQFIANGDADVSQCIIEDMICRYSSIGHLEDCSIDTMNLYGTPIYTAVGCTFTHVQVGGWDGAFLRMENCNSTSFWVSGTGAAELQDCYIWQIRTYNYIHIAATDCFIDIWYNGYVDYPTANATNCTLGTITAIAHTTLTMVSCDIEYFGARDYATVLAENCSFYQFAAQDWAQVTLRGDFGWTQSFNIYNDVVVYRVFSLHMVFSNGTSCSMTEYAVLSTANVTLYTGTTSLLGTDQFTLSFTQNNIAEFDDQYAISVDTSILTCWYQFNVSSSQIMVIIVEEKLAPPEPAEFFTPKEIADSKGIVEVEGVIESPVENQYEPMFTREGSSVIIFVFLVGSCICVSVVISVKPPITFRIASSRRRNHE